MKIIALGGAGDVGSRAVELLAAEDDVTEITIADRALDRAERLASSFAGETARVTARRVDATDHRGLVDAMRGHDLAVSALGPYYRFEAPLVAAALEAEVDYTSVCDEWDATDAVFGQFGDRARETGRLVLPGLGTSPGMSNMGVKLLAAELDEVRRAHVYVYQPLDAGGGEAVVRHMLHIMTGDVVSWQGGRRVLVPACGESRVVEFPQFGPIRLWTMGHAEPATVPRYYPAIEEVAFFMGYGKGAHLFVEPARRGLFRFDTLTEAMVRGLLLVDRWSSKGPPADGAVRLDVWGTAEGREAHRMLCGVGQMREATGVGLAVGSMMVLRAQRAARRAGVFAPEGILDAAEFIAGMKHHGIAAYRDLAMTEPL
ncbi:MAG: saccharopine dehydrogenase NADP-binding domain-containing protein [Deltaproteobacteria bacterium]|jgi:hypothetical protein|nr:saccharopine dehydrogenase NADP-binding domain-containing protein [Deltaproteobacteria bacterium]